MPTSVDQFPLHRALLGIERALKHISTGNGYNTTPNVEIGAKQIREVPIGDMPMIRIEMGDMAPDVQQFGGPSQGEIRFKWTFYVWGFVGTKGTKRDLHQAGNALLNDVYGAIYRQETMPDGAGIGTVLWVEPGKVAYNMESFAETKKGYFMATFEAVVDIERGEDS